MDCFMNSVKKNLKKTTIFNYRICSHYLFLLFQKTAFYRFIFLLTLKGEFGNIFKQIMCQ